MSASQGLLLKMLQKKEAMCLVPPRPRVHRHSKRLVLGFHHRPKARDRSFTAQKTNQREKARSSLEGPVAQKVDLRHDSRHRKTLAR